MWGSKLQTEIALSTAEAEYIILGQSLREVIPAMELMNELNDAYPMKLSKPVFFSVREDNQLCIAMTNAKRMTPRTKDIALKYYNFRHFIERQ